MELIATLVGTGFDTASTAVTWLTANPVTLAGVALGLAFAAAKGVKGLMSVGRRRR